MRITRHETGYDSADARRSLAIADRQIDVPAVYRLWLPFSMLIFATAIGYLANILRAHGYHSSYFDLIATINTEAGLIELATALTLFGAIFHGARMLGPARELGRPLLYLWIVANLLGAIYFLGEEISWGQQIFDWSTGEWFYKHNDQNETNLHNISSWLDQKPRSLLFLWCVAGGIIVPWWYRFRRLQRPLTGWHYWIWPTSSVLFVSILIATVRMPDHMLDLLDVHVSHLARLYFPSFNATEMQEFLYSCFILIYMYSLRTRVGNAHCRARANL